LLVKTLKELGNPTSNKTFEEIFFEGELPSSKDMKTKEFTTDTNWN